VKHTFRYVVTDRPEPGQRVELTPTDSHHLARIVRRRVGDPVELIDGAGRIWPATVAALGHVAVVEVGEPRRAVPPAGVTLYQGLCEWGRLDLVVEKAAELGIPRVVFHLSSRAKRVPEPDTWRRRRGRFARVAESAARQSGQGYLPRVQGLVPLARVLDEVPPGEGYLIDPRGERALPTALAESGGVSRLSLLVGPDAGFTPEEVQAGREAGWQVCSLGPSTLRAETAALVALTVALQATGRFDERGSQDGPGTALGLDEAGEDDAERTEGGEGSATPSR
jgi:16S rRNA (uracil1498-N3)-methyltransferase